MMNDHQTALCSLLLGSFPNFSSGDAEGALGAYGIVMSHADPRDLQPGIMALINGEYSGHDGRFAPTAPQLAGAIRQCRDTRLDSEYRTKLAIAPPAKEDIPEVERERVKAGFDDLIKNLSANLRTQDAEADARRQAIYHRTNARFMPDMSPAEMRKRLGFEIGDREGAEDAA